MDTPVYGLSEAAHYLKIAPATLRSWVVGRNYPINNGAGFFKPLIALQDYQSKLSFNNLIEAYILRSLRQEHSVPIKAVRLAIEYAEKELKISNLLLNKDLMTFAGNLFLQEYGNLINLSKSGQIALKKAFQDHLRRIDWEGNIPSRIYPYIGRDNDKFIAIDPNLKFGRPIIIRKNISTSVIVERIDAGESIPNIADDYELRVDEIDMAVLYERAA